MDFQLIGMPLKMMLQSMRAQKRMHRWLLFNKRLLLMAMDRCRSDLARKTAQVMMTLSLTSSTTRPRLMA